MKFEMEVMTTAMTKIMVMYSAPFSTTQTALRKCTKDEAIILLFPLINHCSFYVKE